MRIEEKFRRQVRQYLYYGIIASLVIVALVFLPMLSSDPRMGFERPESKLGWLTYVSLRIIVGIICFFIFISFDEQGKQNIAEDERYLNAYKKLYEIKDYKYKPMSPSEFKIRTRGIKAITLSITTILGAFIIMECILSYNYNVLIAYAISIFFAIITGIFQMFKSSLYWIEEFPKWVDWLIVKMEKEKEENGIIEG